LSKFNFSKSQIDFSLEQIEINLNRNLKCLDGIEKLRILNLYSKNLQNYELLYFENIINNRKSELRKMNSSLSLSS